MATRTLLNWSAVKAYANKRGKQVSAAALSKLEERVVDKVDRMIMINNGRRLSSDDVLLSSKI